MAVNKSNSGAIVEIILSDNKKAYGRLLKNFSLGVYDKIYDISENPKSVDIINNKYIFQVQIFDALIKKKIFKIIDIIELTELEINNIKPFFRQKNDKGKLDDCIIFDYKGNQRKVSPAECVNIESSSIWTDSGIVKRIQNYYVNKKDPMTELLKVILSEDDPRYDNPNPIWDFEKEEWKRR